MNPTRPTLALLGSLAAATTLLALPSAGADLLDERNLLAWWEHHGTAASAMSLLHLGAIVGALYGALVFGLVAAATALRRPRTANRLARLGPGVVRRWLVAGVVTSALAAPAAAAHGSAEFRNPASAAATDVAITLVDLGPAPPTTRTTAPPPSPAEPIAPPEASDPARESFRPPSPPSAPDGWRVEPGDHLWSIATATLAAAADGEPTTQEVHAYWRALVSANAHQVDDPDLIRPGQVLDLPPVVRGGS